MLSPISNPVMTPLLTIKSRRATCNSFSRAKIRLNTLGRSGSASFKKRVRTSTFGRLTSSGLRLVEESLRLGEKVRRRTGNFDTNFFSRDNFFEVVEPVENSSTNIFNDPLEFN